MPDYIVKADVDTMLRAADNAAIRSAIGVGTTDSPTFLAVTISGDGRKFYLENGDLATGRFGTTYCRFSESVAMLLRASGALGWSSANTQPLPSGDTFLYRDGAAGILAQRNGTSAQAFRVANSVGASPLVDYDRGVFDFKTTTNTLRIGTENGGTYTTARPIEFVTGGVVRMSIAGAGGVNISGTLGNAQLSIRNTSDSLGAWVLSAGHPGVTNGRLGIGHGTSIYVSIIGPTEVNPGYFGLGVSSPTERLDVNGNIKSSGNIKGKITTETAYTATTVVATGYITLYDSTGTAYRVPCAV